ncbi:sugar transferase [Microbacterium suaedae]|uniref:sugar transferase n=1 Tax=Microbacterium suaedae TaxID=2067813 RepID=UPI000DA1AA8A|nr:sugar transferase [Microbacterium suaedae]
MGWRRRYAMFLRWTDLGVLLAVVYGTQVFALGLDEDVARSSTWLGSGGWPYTIVSGIIVIAWMIALALNDTRSDRVIGVGAIEYKRIFDASVMLFGIIAIIAFLTRVELARSYLLLAFPVGVAVLVLERWLWRRWLGAKRSRGEYAARVLLVGTGESVERTARELRRHVGAGYKVVGACVSSRPGESKSLDGVPLYDGLDDVVPTMASVGADTVVITSADRLGPTRVKDISWALEAGSQHLVLAPSITDVAGPRIHTRPVSGLPLMHVETPRFTPGQRFVKRMLDLCGSLLLALLALPVMLVLALAVATTSPGPVMYRQTRIGRHGRRFRMYKFRSMVVDAEKQVESLLDMQDMGNAVLFKMKDDPRVTSVGRFMRRFSLDELPQLFNVIGGSMSLVGPRPPLPTEVEQYADHVHRRFLVKPGITGLWQVSGRSSLSWDDTVRLDLAYVENWSLMSDAVIMFKTARAVIAPDGTSA